MPRKPPKCPACRSDRVRPILYGEPVPSDGEAAKRGELVIGGCLICEGMPTWDCADCRHQFGYLDDSGFGGGGRTTEQWLEVIATMLPCPVTAGEANELVGGAPPIVIVRLGVRQIEILEAAIDWSDVTQPRTVGVPVAKVSRRARPNRVAELIARAHGKRVARYKWCPLCSHTMPPEQMHGNICHGCAERYLNFVH